MKYNVGDKVVDQSSIELLFNPYYKEGKRETIVQTVLEADEKLFTIHDNKGSYDTTLQNARSCGANAYLASVQGSGLCYNGTGQRFLHFVEDRDLIRSTAERTGLGQHHKKVDILHEQLRRTEEEIKRIENVYKEDAAIVSELLGLDRRTITIKGRVYDTRFSFRKNLRPDFDADYMGCYEFDLEEHGILHGFMFVTTALTALEGLEEGEMYTNILLGPDRNIVCTGIALDELEEAASKHCKD